MGFKRNIQGVINGEPVAAGVVNRAVQDIHNNTEYLYDLIRQTRSGEALVAFERTVDEDLAVGMPVFAGMIAATVVGIFVIPMLYVSFQALREATSRRFKGEARSH